MEFKKKHLILENDSEDSVVKKTLSKLKDIKNRANSEIKETRALIKILTHAIKSYIKNREFDLSEEDTKFIKEQSVDVVRNVVLLIISMTPIPIPITPFLIIFGKKIGIDIIPKEQIIPEKGKTKKEKKINESKKINIILTETQYKYLNEIEKKYESKAIKKLCNNQKENKPFCKLYELTKNLNEDDKVELEIAIEGLDKYFRFKNVGLFPVIVDLALQDEGRTVNYLKLISDFVWDEDFNNSETKRVLNRQRNSKILPNDVEDLLRQARTAEHQKYEQKFVGDHFEKKSTFLRLNHYCDDDAKQSLFNILTQVKSEERSIDIVFEQITRCIQKSLTQGSYYVKADIVSKKDLTFENEVIFPSGTNFEVKKMDPFIDSYLSEFFSIFKETEKIAFKGEYIGIYNQLVQRVYEWLISNDDAKEYLNKVKSQMGGIIYEYDNIVPIEYIDLYWSNKGQRGCDEKRLSIRFKIKDDTNQIKTYKYIKEDELSLMVKNVPYKEKQKVICE